jgi:hypothetical protein
MSVRPEIVTVTYTAPAVVWISYLLLSIAWLIVEDRCLYCSFISSCKPNRRTFLTLSFGTLFELRWRNIASRFYRYSFQWCEANRRRLIQLIFTLSTIWWQFIWRSLVQPRSGKRLYRRPHQGYDICGLDQLDLHQLLCTSEYYCTIAHSKLYLQTDPYPCRC